MDSSSFSPHVRYLEQLLRTGRLLRSQIYDAFASGHNAKATFRHVCHKFPSWMSTRVPTNLNALFDSFSNDERALQSAYHQLFVIISNHYEIFERTLFYDTPPGNTNYRVISADSRSGLLVNSLIFDTSVTSIDLFSGKRKTHDLPAFSFWTRKRYEVKLLREDRLLLRSNNFSRSEITLVDFDLRTQVVHETYHLRHHGFPNGPLCVDRRAAAANCEFAIRCCTGRLDADMSLLYGRIDAGANIRYANHELSSGQLAMEKLEEGRFYGIETVPPPKPRNGVITAQLVIYDFASRRTSRVDVPLEEAESQRSLPLLMNCIYAWHGRVLYFVNYTDKTGRYTVWSFDAETLEFRRTSIRGNGKVNGMSIDADGTFFMALRTRLNPTGNSTIVWCRYPLRQPDRLLGICCSTIRRQKTLFGRDLCASVNLPVHLRPLFD